jgi:hypothetical protein
MLDGSVVDPADPGARYATERGIAFVARLTMDGRWHGYPVPWSDVPQAIKDRWVDENLVGRRALRQYARAVETDIQWALASDDDD